MKRALFWSVIPLKNECTRDQVLLENRIGSNSGNLLFHTSMARALTMDENNVPDTCFTSVRGDLDAFAARADERYRAFVMPLANAFRANYMPKLRVLTELVRRLSIPCVVTGVGMQASTMEELRGGLPFDNEVRAFVDAVLNKSAMLGVRGHATAEYLKRLGYREHSHFTVIGCPSMFSFGGALPKIEKKPLNAASHICYNGKEDSGEAMRAFTQRACAMFPDRTYVAQNLEEMWMLRAGVPVLPTAMRRPPKYLPMTRLHPLARRGRAVGFLDAGTWIEAMRQMDLSFGCNIHGNVAALLAGTPAVVLEKDLRVKEIAEYHGIPTISAEALNGGVDPAEAFDKMDFAALNNGHVQRFAHFVDFLDQNGLEHIYHKNEDAPYDRVLAASTVPEAVRPVVNRTEYERAAAREMTSRAIERYTGRIEAKLRRNGGNYTPKLPRVPVTAPSFR